MGRKPRVEFCGALYHVIQRENNREYIFKKNEYKKYFLSKLKEFKDIMNFEVYGYVIMDNHYHLVIRCHEVGEWGKRPHSLKTREAALKRKNQNKSLNTPFTPYLELLKQDFKGRANKNRRRLK